MATADNILLDNWAVLRKAFSIDHPKPANLPSSNPTRSFWTHSSPDANPLAREGSTGSLSTDADICVIGSGMTGVGVAYHLSEAIGRKEPLKVVILEARDFCSGATGRNGGHLTPAAFAGFRARAAKYGTDEAKRSYALEAHTVSSLVRIIEDHGWADDVDLVQGGHIDLLLSNEKVAKLERDREAATNAGWPLEHVVTLDEEEVEATFGPRYPAVKIPGYNLWPVKLVTKLYQQAKMRTGSHFELALHTHTPVTAIEFKNELLLSSSSTDTNTARAYVLSTPRGTIACSRVVHATNGYASHLLPFLSGRQGIVPFRAQVIATRASVGTEEIKINGWSSKGGELSEYWFPRPVKTTTTGERHPLIILGGAREAARPDFEAYVDDDTTCHPVIGDALRAFLPNMFEGKFERGREPEMEWTGIIAYTAIGDPFVGPVDRLPAVQRHGDSARYAGQYIAAGYSGHGMPRAFACAEVVAQMITAELAGTEWTQPSWLPTCYLTWEERESELKN